MAAMAATVLLLVDVLCWTWWLFGGGAVAVVEVCNGGR